MQETLVIVHLSSIDSYIRFYGVKPAMELAVDLCLAITSHPGSTVIMDQEDDDISEDGKVMRAKVLEMQNYCPVTIFHHDEMMDLSPWQDGMKNLAHLLRQLKTYRIRLGGLWTSESGKSGCVHEVKRQMSYRGFPGWIDKSICALEENDVRWINERENII